MRQLFQKYRKTLIILALAPVLILLSRLVDTEDDTFSFNMNGYVSYTVSEQGILRYQGGKTKELNNKLNVSVTYSTEQGRLTMNGSSTGHIDKELQPLLNKSSFNVTLDRENPETFCPSKISPIYPSVLRRFFYYFPQRYLFEGKRWKAYFCNQQIICNYSISSIVDENAHIDLFCDGKIDHQEIAMSAKLTFHIDRQVFRNITGRFHIKNSIMDATWNIEDTLVSLQ